MISKHAGFSGFLKNYKLDDGCAPVDVDVNLDLGSSAAKAIRSVFGGRSFNTGTFRVFAQESIEMWDERIGKTFPAFSRVISCVGYGWDGRIIAETIKDYEDLQKGVAIFVPSTADSLNAPIDILTFLNQELSDSREDILDTKTYRAWLKSGGASVQYDECVGYNVPLFLSGEDALKNMDITDLEVYWEMTAPLIEAYFEAEDGDEIGPVTLNA